MSTFGELVDECLRHGFRAAEYRPRFQAWINTAQGRICRAVDVPTLRAITEADVAAGDNTVQFADPNTVARIDYVKLDGHPLVNLGNRTGEPAIHDERRRAFRVGPSTSSIRLLPAADKAGKMEVGFYRLPPTLVDATDVPIIDPGYHDLLVSWALERGFRAEDDTQMAQFYKGEFDTGFAEYRGDINQPVVNGPRQVPGTWGAAGWGAP